MTFKNLISEEFSLRNYKSKEIPIEDLKVMSKFLNRRLREIFTSNFMAELKRYMKNKIKIKVEDRKEEKNAVAGWVYNNPKIKAKKDSWSELDTKTGEFKKATGPENILQVARTEFLTLNYIFLNKKYLINRWFKKENIPEFIDTLVHEFLHLVNFRYSIKRINKFLDKFKKYDSLEPLKNISKDTYTKRREIFPTILTAGYVIKTYKSKEEVINELYAINIFKKEFLEKQIRVRQVPIKEPERGRDAKKTIKTEQLINYPGNKRLIKREKSLSYKREEEKHISQTNEFEQKRKEEEQKAQEERARKKKQNRIRSKRKRANK